MNSISKKRALASAIVAIHMFAAAAGAAITVRFDQVGSDVIITTSGSTVTSSLVMGQAGAGASNIIEAGGSTIFLVKGLVPSTTTWSSTDPDIIVTTNGWTQFGGNYPTTYVSGDTDTYVGHIDNRIALTPDWMSGDSINSVMKVTNASFASVGLTAETSRVLTWGTGLSAGSIVFSTGAVPEPSTALLTGFASLVLLGIRRRLPH